MRASFCCLFLTSLIVAVIVLLGNPVYDVQVFTYGVLTGIVVLSVFVAVMLATEPKPAPKKFAESEFPDW